MAAMLAFLSDVKADHRTVTAPVYTHARLPWRRSRRGRHRRAAGHPHRRGAQRPANDDALPPDGSAASLVLRLLRFLDLCRRRGEGLIGRWYVERFKKLRETAFQDPRSYFHRFAGIDDAEAETSGDRLWNRINLQIFVQNILPTRPPPTWSLEKVEPPASKNGASSPLTARA